MLKNLDKYNIILASNSPRRKEILKDMGIKFEVRASNIDENITSNLAAKDVPIFLAQKKSEVLRNRLKENEILITADTVVLYNNEIITKPTNYKNAREILKKLSNKKHEVITGVCLSNKDKTSLFASKTDVTFNKLSDYEIDLYIKIFKPYDKAGSYGIQEWIGLIGVKKINGSYTNVVGLPSSRLYQELNKFI
tara:strand:+ start:335 stop:916 length:582 start_codon:yes stop_codon:yes gene_type:complete